MHGKQHRLSRVRLNCVLDYLNMSKVPLETNEHASQQPALGSKLQLGTANAFCPNGTQ